MKPVTATGDYRSPASSPGALAACCPSILFHWKMLSIYVKASRLAVRGQYDGSAWARSSLDVLRNLESVGVRVTTQNMDVLRQIRGPCVFVANHMSTLETFVLPCLIQPHLEVTFIVKDSLMRFPVFGPVMRSRDPVTVGRTDPRQDLKKVLEGGGTRLARGRSMIVFPQTTRSQTLVPEQFNTIGVKLARRASVPVVPVALKTDAWSVGWPLKDFGPIHPDRPVYFAFGEPIKVQGSGREEHEEVVRFIAGKLEEWE